MTSKFRNFTTEDNLAHLLYKNQTNQNTIENKWQDPEFSQLPMSSFGRLQTPACAERVTPIVCYYTDEGNSHSLGCSPHSLH